MYLDTNLPINLKYLITALVIIKNILNIWPWNQDYISCIIFYLPSIKALNKSSITALKNFKLI